MSKGRIKRLQSQARARQTGQAGRASRLCAGAFRGLGAFFMGSSFNNAKVVWTILSFMRGAHGLENVHNGRVVSEDL